MSCRVLHRGVEQRLLQQLAETALARGKAQVLVRSGKGYHFLRGATKMVVVPGNVWHLGDDLYHHKHCDFGFLTGFTTLIPSPKLI